MNFQHTIAIRCATLIAVVVFCCGFSWGLGKSDPCNEARTTLNALSTVTDPITRAKREETVLKACPNGARDAAGMDPALAEPQLLLNSI